MSGKFPSSTLQNISLSQWKEVFKDSKNREISGTKEFVRDFIEKILSETGKENIPLAEFETMKKYIEHFTPYVQILRKYRKDFSFFLLEWLIAGQSPEEFEKFCEDENVGEVLRNVQEKNLQLLMKFCKNILEFKDLCENWDVRDVLQDADEETLREMIEKCKSVFEFEEMCEKWNLENF